MDQGEGAGESGIRANGIRANTAPCDDAEREVPGRVVRLLQCGAAGDRPRAPLPVEDNYVDST